MGPVLALRILESVVDVVKRKLAGKTKNIIVVETVIASLQKLIGNFSEAAFKFI
jgi:hypothetical protein